MSRSPSPEEPDCRSCLHAFDLKDQTHVHFPETPEKREFYDCEKQPCPEAYRFSLTAPRYYPNFERLLIPTKQYQTETPVTPKPSRSPSPDMSNLTELVQQLTQQQVALQQQVNHMAKALTRNQTPAPAAVAASATPTTISSSQKSSTAKPEPFVGKATDV
ncbi:hypothetical protein VKT23_011323 [Stygiomarasmius scandens]|uniref:Uncharacterized protein n=1 Tax=Marasmiellus scandens TaxID=2682957 RepID=A0ABR1JDS9_9AGAR